MNDTIRNEWTNRFSVDRYSVFVKLCVSTTFLYLLRVTFVSRSDIYASTSIYIQAV